MLSEFYECFLNTMSALKATLMFESSMNALGVPSMLWECHECFWSSIDVLNVP